MTKLFRHARCAAAATALLLVATTSFAAADRFGLVHGSPGVCADVGVGWTRFDFTWAGVERKPGEFDFTSIDRQLDEYEKHGIKVLPILDYNPPREPDVSPASAEALDAWCRYVEATVRHFKDRLTYWQVWNEPNYSIFWKPKPDAAAYAELLKRSYETIKRVDPNLKVIGFNCSDIDLKFTQTVIDHGGLDHCDLLAYQPYRIAPEAGHFEEIAALREMLTKYGAADKPIWFTEMGWASEWFPFSDAADNFAERPNRRHSAFLVRYMTLIMASGIDRVFWFSEGADSHGLIDGKTGKKRMAYGVYQDFLRTVGDFTRIHEIVPHGFDDTYAYLFECPNRSVLIAWRATGNGMLPLGCLRAAREARLFDGQPIALQKGAESLPIGEEPVYVIFDQAPAELRARAAIGLPSGRIEVHAGETIDVPVAYRPAAGGTTRRWRVHTSEGLDATPGSIVPRDGHPAMIHLTAEVTIPRTCGISLESRGLTQAIQVMITPKTLWTYQGPNKGYLSPVLYRGISGGASILYGFWDAPDLFCLSLDGKERWTYDTGTPLYGSPTLADVTGDGHDEIVVATPNDQTIHAVDQTGHVLWKTTLPGEPLKEKPQYNWTHAAACDFNGDGIAEIVYGDSNGAVHLLDGDGTIRWSRKVAGVPIAAPVFIGHVLPDTGMGILAATKDGWLHRIAPSGEEAAGLYIGAALSSEPVELPRDSRPAPFIMLTTAAEIAQPLPYPALLPWRVALGGTVEHGAGVSWGVVAAGRLGYSRKENEIVLSTRNNDVKVYRMNGDVVSSYRAAGQLRCHPAIGDIDGDGENEIIIGSADWKLYCFGKRPWIMNMGHRIDCSALLVDIDGDGSAEIIQAARNGKVVALSAR